jgi:hypothetical protein
MGILTQHGVGGKDRGAAEEYYLLDDQGVEVERRSIHFAYHQMGQIDHTAIEKWLRPGATAWFSHGNSGIQMVKVVRVNRTNPKAWMCQQFVHYAQRYCKRLITISSTSLYQYPYVNYDADLKASILAQVPEWDRELLQKYL